MFSADTYEKLGLFYLGREVAEGGPLLYDASHLVTHGVIVGMTGSGKTGLGAVLLEEAAIDGVPSIVVDPKGDLANLALTFPELRAEDFAPWAPRGEDPAALARRAREGLESTGQTPERIGRFASAVERTLFTPGGSHGAPLSVAGSLAPTASDDVAAQRERAIGTVSALLSLVGVDADPVRSAEHGLVTAVLLDAWGKRETLSTAELLRRIQDPPFDRIGAMALETVLSGKERQKVALAINNAFASPAFAAFVEGPPLDIDSLLFTADGRPRLSIVSIAHLSDEERMFFVTLLLHELVAWTRRQKGTQSLRALFYMDEVFGFFPPVATPSSKAPMLTLLKQARAFGLGVVLATQNPVDLDYKALGNTGSWFLGRLQTERDKARLLEGMRAAGVESAQLDALLSTLPKRQFVLHDVHRGAPTLFETRWALSYLRGPLDRDEIARLAGPRPSQSFSRSAEALERPVLDPGIEEIFLVRSDLPQATTWAPGLLVHVSMSYPGAKRSDEIWLEATLVAPLGEAAPRFGEGWFLLGPPPATTSEPHAPLRFAALPAPALRADSYRAWTSDAISHVARERPLTIGAVPSLDLRSSPGESSEAFAARAQLVLREQRDAAIAALNAKYATKIEKARAKVAQSEERLAKERSERTGQRLDAGISAVTVLGALVGRGSVISNAARVARSANRAAKQADDVERAEARVDASEKTLAELAAEAQTAIAEVEQRFAPAKMTIERDTLAAKKVEAKRVALVWVPTP